MRRTSLGAIVIVGVVSVAFLAPSGFDRETLKARGLPRPAYLALGDSLAVGTGASRADASGYVALFHQFLRSEDDSRYELRAVAKGGATSTTLIHEGQLVSALDILHHNADDEPNNDVQVITIDIGGDDLRTLVRGGAPCEPPASPADPACVGAVVQLLADYRANIATILTQLRAAAGPETRIFVVTVMNPYSGTGGPLDQPSDPVIALLNAETQAAAADPWIRAVLVDVFPIFASRAHELTNLDKPRPDFHPNDEGYRLMAEAIVKAYREQVPSGSEGQ
ncbi:MAG: SGNH/GDSL hydrolase family protein [Dehalococcoidia bacterium]